MSCEKEKNKVNFQNRWRISIWTQKADLQKSSIQNQSKFLVCYHRSQNVLGERKKKVNFQNRWRISIWTQKANLQKSSLLTYIGPRDRLVHVFKYMFSVFK